MADATDRQARRRERSGWPTARDARVAVAEMGTVPERAAVGHRARGLQRLGRRLELLHATIRRARAPTAGAKTASPASPTTSSCSASRVALWNGKDPILKERLFGLTNSEGNHGEDVKEYYFYLDSTPTHSYMKYLYKYPQAAYPVRRPRRAPTGSAAGTSFEYELLDTGVFDDDRYFDVFVEYAKASPEDILIQITVSNRGPEAATLHVLPTLWFRNTWSWGGDAPRPSLPAGRRHGARSRRRIPSSASGSCTPTATPTLLFTENETNTERSRTVPNRSPVRQGRHQQLRRARPARRREPGRRRGTKAAAHYALDGRRRARRRCCACGCPTSPRRPTPRASRRRRVRRRLRRDHDDAPHARPTSSTPSVIPASLDRGRRQRDAAGAGRHAVVEAVLQLRRRPLARPSAAPIRSSRAAASAAQRPLASHAATPTSSRCRTSGSIRGTPRGTSPFTCSR